MVFLKLIVWLCVVVVSIVVGGYLVIAIGGWVLVGFIATNGIAYKIGFGVALLLIVLSIVTYTKLLFGSLSKIIKS